MVILDFDGVLIDSVNEVMVTAYRALTGRNVTALTELPSPYLTLFRANRPLVQPASDLLALAAWALKYKGAPGKILTEAEYDEILKNSGSSEERREKFFGSRAAFIAENKSAWLSLNTPFQPMWNAVTKSTLEFTVLTNKNRAAVHELFSFYGTALKDDHLFSGDGGKTKQENFKELRTRFPSSFYHFIDDCIHNLTEMREEFSPAEIDLSLATWGYLGETDAQDAKEKSFGTLSQKEAAALFK